MPDPVKCLFEVYEDMVQILLMLQMFLTEDTEVEDLFSGTSSWSETSLFFSKNLLCLWFQSVE